MTKANITQYSSTASSNTDINDINIDENCPASGLNNAIRELMAHLKNVDTGTQALTALSVTGETTLASHLNMGDNDKIKLGASGDLEIYHDASNSYVDDTGTGRLYLRGNDRVQIQKYTGEDMVTAIADGAVNLYYDNSKMFETTSGGVTVNTAMSAINTGGDAHVQIKGNTRDFKIEQNNYGLRVYDTDASSERLRIDASGAMTLPLQPAFLAHPSSTIANISTGANNSLAFATERFDQNSDYNNSNYLFTAPITGKYQANVVLYLNQLDSAVDYYELMVSTSNKAYYGIFDPDFGQDNSYYTLTFSALVDMDASDTCGLNLHQQGGSSQTDVSSLSMWSMYLVC